jgi:hypothetical protein
MTENFERLEQERYTLADIAKLPKDELQKAMTTWIRENPLI